MSSSNGSSLRQECDQKGEILMEIYVSTDIEADGPIPGPYSMLSFASAAYMADKILVDTYYATLDTLPGATVHPDTKRWWEGHPEAWEASRQDTRPAEQVMLEYVEWLKKLPGKPVFVAHPAAYDFMFIYWYLIRFAGESPFGSVALDMKTLAMSLLGIEFFQATKGNMPNAWFDPAKHTHIALDDALEQGELFCNMLRKLEELRRE
jgi:DNA polymerase III alpha subunit (gram-positive type)